ncbi:MAG TPA: (2Fe-2S)-binding protein [Planctomycetes bacterium]|nr:(2Fe-2S)-binding protein [Planctomycetota bacterium]
MELDDKVCYCFRVSRRKLLNFTRQTQPPRASQLSECFGAGTGCGWCIPYLIKIHRDVMSDGVLEAEDISPAEYERLRLDYQQQVAAGDLEKNRHDKNRGDALDCDLDDLL